MNLPDRIMTPYPLKCSACGLDLPPAVTAFSINGNVYCEPCMWRAKTATELSVHTFATTMRTVDWPEEIDLEDV